MIKPERLKKGDTVAVVSLSAGIAGEKVFLNRFNKGCSRLKEDFGLIVKVMPNALNGVADLYRHPEKRAQDLMEAFLDQEVKAVICAIGGDDTVRLMPYIDYEIIKNNPKIFMGYSDSTANHFMMYKAGLISYHGPCVMAEFAENVMMHRYTKDYIERTLFTPEQRLEIKSSKVWTSEYLEWTDSGNDEIKRSMTEERRGFELLQGTGTVRGRLLGGNSSIMQMIMGSELWPVPEEWDNKLLFIETAEDYPAPDFLRYFLRALLIQGILKRINGIIVGKPLDEKYYEEYKQVYLDVVGAEAGRPELPVLYNVNCSHTAPVCIMPYGIEAEINCDKKTLTILEETVL